MRRECQIVVSCEAGPREIGHIAAGTTAARSLAVCRAGELFLDYGAMFLEIPLLVLGAIRWTRAQPRPGVIAAAIIVATCATMISSSITVARNGERGVAIDALTVLAIAGLVLVVLVHVISRLPDRRDDELVTAARALAPGAQHPRHEKVEFVDLPRF